MIFRMFFIIGNGGRPPSSPNFGKFRKLDLGVFKKINMKWIISRPIPDSPTPQQGASQPIGRLRCFMYCTLIYLFSKSTSFPTPPPQRNNQGATLKKLKALLQVKRKATLSPLLPVLKTLYLYHASLF